MRERYFRSVFIPSLEGQHKLWANVIAREASQSDEIVQFGNLVGLQDYAKDRDNYGNNERLLRYIMIFRATQPRWTQLVGPNEIIALNAPDEWTNQTSRKILRDSWVGDARRMAVAAVSKKRLVTHGGLTYGEWVSLGRPSTAEETAELLNAKYIKTLYQGPCYNLGDAPNYSANPIWAHSYRELYPSWLSAPEALPFDQLHGSSSINSLEGRSFVDDEHSLYPYADALRYKRWGATLTIKGQKITNIDLRLPDVLLSQLPEERQMYVERLAPSKPLAGSDDA